MPIAMASCTVSQHYLQYRLLYTTCIVPAKQELDREIVQKLPTEMLVAGEVSSARHYYKLRACLFGKRYRTLVASPTFSIISLFS
jgi:hypothetical protein